MKTNLSEIKWMKNAPTNQNLKINMNNYISLKFGCDYFGRDENILHREI